MSGRPVNLCRCRLAGCRPSLPSISEPDRHLRSAVHATPGERKRAVDCSRRVVTIGIRFWHDNRPLFAVSGKGWQVGHESYERHEDVRGSSDRAFGIVFAAVFAIIGLLPLVFGGRVRLWALLVAGAFLLVAQFVPSMLAPLNRWWLRFGLLLHRIVSPIVLGIMFFGVITPMGLVMRALGKDLLRLKFDRVAPTYWIERTPPGPPPESMKDQF